MTDVFIIGSRGLPAKYGGFETFVEELVKHQKDSQITYHVACLSNEEHGSSFEFMGAKCFTIKPPKLGPARVIAYDMMAINYALDLIKTSEIKNPVFYILGNTIGSFIAPFAKKIRAVGGKLYVNPDGLEWKRSKWSKPVQIYLKYSEKVMSKQADLLISDNMGIDSYLKSSYPWVKTRHIAYGTELSPSDLDADHPLVRAFFDKWQSKEKDYFLIVGRFVPENNYEHIIREFMAADTKRDLLIICNHEGNPYFDKLKALTHFDKDKRIKFVGTVYDRELLAYLREQAFAYLHGHEVGGTNPGLLEALAHTNLNMILDVTFNREVAKDTAYYWSKEEGALKSLLERTWLSEEIASLGQAAKNHMRANYTWETIVGQYEELFLDES